MKNNDIKRIFAKYVSLNIIGMIGLSCYILADTFFVARGIGADGLTALNLAIPIYSFINGTGLMIGIGGATRFSISQSKTAFTQSLYCAILAGCLFFLTGIFFSKGVASLLGADAATLQNTDIYLKTILCFAPLFLTNNVIICFVRNDGNPRLSMAAMLISSLSNIILDYVFVFPCEMGMFGAALATGLAPAISLILLSSHFIRKHNTLKLIKQKLSFTIFKDISSLGASALITEFSSGIVIIVFNAIILNLEGNTGVAAYGIIANIALVVLAVFTGISQGIQPIISLNYGIDNISAAKKTLKYGLITAVLLAVSVYTITSIFAEPITQIFNKDSNPALTQIAVNGLRIYFTAFLFAGINILVATYFSASDKPKKAFAISILRGFIVIIPSAFILSTIFGINGVWLAMTFTELVVLAVSFRLYTKV